MAEQLKNTLSFNLAPSASVVIPHGLQTILSTPLAPDIIFVPSPDLDVSSDTVNVTLTNVGAEQLTGAVLVESWHTIERAFGDEANKDLPVKPYIVVSVEGGNQPPQPPFTENVVIIYARTAGSDVTGDGRTIPTAYQTMQRAVRDVPSNIPASVTYIIDVTGIDEIVPTDYTLPAWKAPGNLELQFGQFPVLPAYDSFFLARAPVNIWAVPQAVPSLGTDAVINSTDVVVSNDPITSLITLTFNIPRPSLVGSEGKFVVFTGGAFALINSVIDSVGPGGAFITITNKFNFGNFPLTIMEPSAHIHGNGSAIGGAINSINVDCITFGGLKIDNDLGGGNTGLYAAGLGATLAELCVLDSPRIASVAEDIQNRIIFSWVTGSPQVSGSIGFGQSFFDAISGQLFSVPVYPTIFQCSFRGCDPIQPQQRIPLSGFGAVAAGVENFIMEDTLILGSTNNGIVFSGTNGFFANLDISNCVGDGILLKNGSGNVRMFNLGSSIPNGGVGVRITDGLFAQVDADTSTTEPTALRPLTGAGGDMQVGSLPVRTWANFIAAGPTQFNEYDIAFPPVTGVTGSRLYQK